MFDAASPTYARIIALLETVEAHEREGRPLGPDDLGATPMRAEAEVRWLEGEQLVRVEPFGGGTACARLAYLTAHGRGTLALMRGEATLPCEGAE